MRLYGVTEEGHSVVAHIHGYDPYFYVQVSLRCARALSLSLRYLLKISLEYFLEAPASMTSSMCDDFAGALNKRMENQ
eukprot:2544961-Rhodomonas_salina.1